MLNFLVKPHFLSQPKKIYEYSGEKNEEVTILVPVYNQEKEIRKNLLSIIDNLYMRCSLLIIDDASNDESVGELLKFAKIAVARNFNITIYKNKHPKFETYCDNFLFSKCQSEFAIEVQADMNITEKNFDLKLYQAINSNKKFIAISGRGTHDFDSVYENFIRSLGTDRAYENNFFKYFNSRIKYQLYRNLKNLRKDFESLSEESTTPNPYKFYTPESAEFLTTGNVGRLGNLIELLPSEESLNCRKIWCGETIMRGPIIVDNHKYKLVGGLDTSRFFQGFDDHELFLKSNIEFGFRVGYTPVGFSSPISLGSSRRPRNMKNEILIMINIVKRIKKISTSYLKNYPIAKKRILIQREILEY